MYHIVYRIAYRIAFVLRIVLRIVSCIDYRIAVVLLVVRFRSFAQRAYICLRHVISGV